MNHADEWALVWALADGAAPHQTASARIKITTKIGAGDLEGALVDLLTFYGETGTAVSRDLATALDAWVFGYSGAPDEPRLRRLVDRLRLRSKDLSAESPPAASADGGVS